MTTKTTGGKKGFASMPEDKREKIAQKGGKASAYKAGHESMSERGQQGGKASGESRREEK